VGLWPKEAPFCVWLDKQLLQKISNFLCYLVGLWWGIMELVVSCASHLYLLVTRQGMLGKCCYTMCNESQPCYKLQHNYGPLHVTAPSPSGTASSAFHVSSTLRGVVPESDATALLCRWIPAALVSEDGPPALCCLVD